MSLEQSPFKRYHDGFEKKYDTFTVRLNDEERDMLDNAKRIIQQPKDSTALKQLAEIGYLFVTQDKKTAKLLEYLFGNKRRNQRTGILEVE
jgi:hypothetical protein